MSLPLAQATRARSDARTHRGIKKGFEQGGHCRNQLLAVADAFLADAHAIAARAEGVVKVEVLRLRLAVANHSYFRALQN